MANKSFWFVLVLNVFLFRSSSIYAQDSVDDTIFTAKEKYISQLVGEVENTKFDDVKIDTLNSLILEEFSAILKKEGSFNYPFDSIFPVGKVVSDDKRVRIFTWFVIYADGTHKQFGFIQYYSTLKNKVLLFPLMDRSDSIKNADNVTLTTNNWYGATYYDIVHTKDYYGDLYVLLGWDGNNLFSKKKIIESLRIKNDVPKFGFSVFKAGKETKKRVIFEYSRMSSMMLKYDKTYNMIVFDHLEPSDYIYEGNYQYYGPDLSVDALKYEGEMWIYHSSIDYKPYKSKRFKR
jgi:hypothetical protein